MKSLKTIYRPLKFTFLVFVFALVIYSCKQKNNTQQYYASSRQIEDTVISKVDSLDDKINALMTKYHIPGVNIAFIENGQLNVTRNYGVLQKGGAEKVTNETMFSVGSISKVANAILTLQLVKAGKLDLDTDVNTYLKDWKVAQTKFNKDTPVTLRHILSHTAGFSVHGFEDFYPGEKLPNTLEILSSTGPAKNEAVILIFPVGSKFKYSGGGITVIQKIIEDVTGLPYHQAASELLFEPLQLKRMTFQNPLPETYGNIAKAHDEKGNPVALPRGYQAMPEMAASGLWTTVQDLSVLLSHVMAVGNTETSDFLTPQLIQDMITKEENTEFGLGPYIDTTYKNYKIVRHNGANESYRANFTLFWKESKGYVIFTNGSNGTKLINEVIPILNTHLNL